jgi:release factor glutamine methyltransferase
VILREVLERTTAFFKEKNFPSPRFESELLISFALALKRVDLYLKFDRPLSEDEVKACREVVRRRTAGESVAYITQSKGFYTSDFAVGPGVLVPRPETEALIEEALTWIKMNGGTEAPVRVLDLGTGSGCVGLSVAKLLPNSHALLVDSSAEALAYAEKNRQLLGLAERADLLNCKVEDLDLIPTSFDIVLANPPYIAKDDQNVEEAVKKFEPDAALFAENFGLGALEKWIPVAASLTSLPGICIFEIGATQAQAVKELFSSTNAFDKITVKKDLAGLDRNVVGIRNGVSHG